MRWSKCHDHSRKEKYFFCLLFFSLTHLLVPKRTFEVNTIGNLTNVFYRLDKNQYFSKIHIDYMWVYLNKKFVISHTSEVKCNNHISSMLLQNVHAFKDTGSPEARIWVPWSHWLSPYSTSNPVNFIETTCGVRYFSAWIRGWVSDTMCYEAQRHKSWLQICTMPVFRMF